MREEAGTTILQLMQEINTMSLYRFQVDVLSTRAKYERSDAIIARRDAGLSPAFLSSCYPFDKPNSQFRVRFQKVIYWPGAGSIGNFRP